MEYTLKEIEFEGPLDLLLHLIKEANVDIFDINISEITEQYLNYINMMNELNLDVDSEYLVMAADLIEIKSRELLPHDEEEIEEDPKEELINRLVEYQKYKEVTSELRKLEEDRSELYSKLPSILDELTLDDIIKAFATLKEKQILEKPLNTVVTKKEYSVNKRSKEILGKLKKSKKLEFKDLFDTYTKEYVVVTFLSILDLARKGNILLNQDKNLGSIILKYKDV